jgi:hypothetical protein
MEMAVETAASRTCARKMIAMTMRQIALLAICCVGLALRASGQEAYELYSWQETHGRWNFCVLPSPSGVNLSAEQVFNKKNLLNGVEELKHKLSTLRMGATIYWLDRILGTSQAAEESPRLKYPPFQMTQDIRHYCARRKIKVEMLAGERGQH